MISKFLQILGLQPRISIFFSWLLEQFFLTVGQNNFGNKIPFNDYSQVFVINYKLTYTLMDSDCMNCLEDGTIENTLWYLATFKRNKITKKYLCNSIKGKLNEQLFSFDLVRSYISEQDWNFFQNSISDFGRSFAAPTSGNQFQCRRKAWQI